MACKYKRRAYSGLAFCLVALLIYHNLRHPARKIPFFHYIPVEFREEDEGLQWVTYRACRKTYIFLYSAVPVGLVLIAFGRSIPIVPIAMLTLIGVVPLLFYWWELRKWHKGNE
ncbi:MULTISPECIES: hypothetical protein [unclassified Paenibacillus]|uniref:hypothetical protein n=1 Tax=unclassified Paenibacillus TaxID=185978 RepID=UPI001AE897F2|nr:MULTISPECIES: hypothetical protein [unclassified Paenibacillus]MBP1157589.1 hypothetical protein [Paenibacillus sp. PvP091]MBP1171674.1 hypothetical protein [Paenibacillus sp. PvR098]MBP2438055.1 hypothetical protein [Paenibacillus sp. PvP052]